MERSSPDAAVKPLWQAMHRSAVSKTDTPDFVFRRGTPYAKAVCFSCGAVMPEPDYGRCWRCSLAWRMSVGVPIPAALAQAYDESKMLA